MHLRECLIHLKTMINLFEEFSLLAGKKHLGGFTVSNIFDLENHKIGISPENYPIFFIRCLDYDQSILGSSLAMIKIEFSKECILYADSIKEEGLYTLVTLKSEVSAVQKYFIDILYLVIKKMPAIPTTQNVRLELNTIIKIFRNFVKQPIKSIQGVWSEMLVIENAHNVDYLVNAWHSNIYSKFDFNDGIDKIEVKSTSKERRIHRFSISQLYKNPSSNLVIASVMTSQIGIGITILDIREMIFSHLVDKNLILKIDEIISKTLGSDIDKITDFSFDYNSAVDSLKFFKSEDIPTISQNIPKEITNINFDCDISDLVAINKWDQNSTLITSLNFKNSIYGNE